MGLKDEFADTEAYELETGTPTLTVCEEGREVMIPWMSFRHAIMEPGTIRLHFQNWMVEIRGEGLDLLWHEIQLQTVHAIAIFLDVRAGACIIQSVCATSV